MIRISKFCINLVTLRKFCEQIWWTLYKNGHLGVGELETGDAEHDLAGGDDDVLGHHPQHVDKIVL